jgi:oligoendopeptidase F
MHKKFHPDENVYEYQERWEQLRNSLNAKFFEYKDQLVLAEKENDDIADFNDLAKDLADYVRIDGQTLRHIIRYKELPPKQKNQKPTWMKSYAEAACFSDEIGLKISEWNKCFIHHNGKKLCASHRSDPQYKEQPIKNRLSKYKKLFDCK